MSLENDFNFHGLCHFIGRLHKAATRGMRTALTDCPKCHFSMLESLIFTIERYGTEDGVYVSDLAQALKQPLPAVSRGLRMLEQDGCIERQPDPKDRRKTLVRLTPKGRQSSQECEAALNDYFRRITRRLSPEQLDQLMELKDVLIDAIEAENAAAESNPLKGD